MLDVLIIGAGPAGLSLAAGLVQAGVAVQGLSATPVDKPWPNTYGIWVDEMAALDLTDFLKHRWQDCVVYVDQLALDLNREYGLIDNDQLQAAWLAQTQQHNMLWHQAKATQIAHSATGSTVTTDTGQTLTARLVIDASGHHSPFIQRCSGAAVAYQAAYGIVGRFSQPPIGSGQMVLMDYRDDHLENAERAAPPTFLYAMDLGNDVYFVEETSLAHRPAITLDVLEKRLYQRLAQRQVTVTEVHHVERCLFPMNLPLPDLQQPVLGFGGAASLVHPASGYMMGAILRRGPAVVQAVIQALDIAEATPHQLAQAGWQALWPPERLRKNYLYRFGLENLMAWDGPQLQRFFATFFGLKLSHWSSFLADTLSLPELVGAMLVLFSQAPNGIRWDLMRSVFPHYGLLLPTFIPGQLRTHVPD